MMPTGRTRVDEDARARLTAATRAGRQRTRQHLGKLSSLRVSSNTHRRYVLAYIRLGEWLADAGVLPLQNCLAMDKAMSAYVETLWEEGDPKCWASDALASLQFVVPIVKAT